MGAKGSFSINRTVPQSSSWTEEIDLAGAYEAGMVMFQVPQSAVTSYRKYGMSIMVGTSMNEAIAGTNFKQTVHCGCGCYTSCIGFKFYLFENDGQLSDNYFKGGGLGRIRITSAYIDGTILKITFLNDHTYQDATLKIDGKFLVWKVKAL